MSMDKTLHRDNEGSISMYRSFKSFASVLLTDNTILFCKSMKLTVADDEVNRITYQFTNRMSLYKSYMIP